MTVSVPCDFDELCFHLNTERIKSGLFYITRYYSVLGTIIFLFNAKIQNNVPKSRGAQSGHRHPRKGAPPTLGLGKVLTPPPALGLGKVLTTPHCKAASCYEMFT